MNCHYFVSAMHLRAGSGLASPAVLRRNEAAAKRESLPRRMPRRWQRRKAAAKGDALLEALLTELRRSYSQLKMDQVQAPYYIEYRVNDVDDYQRGGGVWRGGAEPARARAHSASGRAHRRLQTGQLFRVGTGETNILPLDNDPIALRHQIWLATDDAYKSAAQALAEKQAALRQFSADATPVDDFAKRRR